MNRRRAFSIACILAAAPCGSDAQLPMHDCRLAVPWLPGVAAQCARLSVPENRADPGGRSIELSVARVAALNADPRTDPLVIIAGGPGQAATDFYVTARGAFERIRRDRDIVLVDQRGTGRSAPLSCEQASAASLEQADVDALPSLMRACLADLDGDPRYYTSSVAVRDLEAVRRALGVTEWNLYGVSYGTRVAQHYLRRYPDATRALILDGVVPSGSPMGVDVAVQAQRVLDRILDRCAAAPACAERYPGVGNQLESLLETLETAPAEVRVDDPLTAVPMTRTMTRELLGSVLRLLSYTPHTAALLPLLIDAANDGNYEPLAAQGEMISGELQSVLSLPMHNAVVCTEDVPFFPDEPPAGTRSAYLGTGVIDALRAACSVWPAGILDSDLRMPLGSARPVLLLSGEVDPITPPAYAERVLAGLGRARHVVAPGQGHGLAGVGCVPRLMSEFLDQLDPAAIDVGCIEDVRPSPFFLDFNGPSP